MVGIETSYLTLLMDGEVRLNFNNAVNLLSDLGATIEEVRIPRLKASLATLVAILFSEAASIHRRFLDERPMDYGADVRRSLLSGRLYKAEDYVEAQRVRAVLKRDLADTFKTVDMLAMPTVIIQPPEWGQDQFLIEARSLDILNAFIRCTAPFNLTGNPALSVPCGRTSRGLPVGLQLVGPLFSEDLLLRSGCAFEAIRGTLEKMDLA